MTGFRDDPVFSLLSGSETCSEVSSKNSAAFETTSLKPSSTNPSSNPSTSKKNRRTVLVQELENGWTKEATRTKGDGWSVVLMNQDKERFRTEQELGVYLAAHKVEGGTEGIDFTLPEKIKKVR